MKFRTYIILVSSFALAQGILGSIGFSGPLPANSIFGSAWYFDQVENITHTLFGLVGLLAGLLGTSRMQRTFGYVLAATALIVGGASAMGPITSGVTILGAALQNPADTILHIFFGTLTLWLTVKDSIAGSSKKK